MESDWKAQWKVFDYWLCKKDRGEKTERKKELEFGLLIVVLIRTICANKDDFIFNVIRQQL